MSLIVQDNLLGLNALNNLNTNSLNEQNSMQKLSSGYRINTAADDAAGWAISQKMTNQVNGLNQASRNAQDAISLVQTAQGAYTQVTNILTRMRELAVQASSDTNTTADRSQTQKEVSQLASELNQIASTTQFNTKNLLDGSNGTLKFQVGANNGQTITVSMYNVKGTIASTTLSTMSVSTQTNAAALITKLDNMISTVSGYSAQLGAVQNRLQFITDNLNTASQNLTAANSRVKDVDMAAETMNFTKNQILVQASTAMLAQANQAPQAVLSLLR